MFNEDEMAMRKERVKNLEKTPSNSRKDETTQWKISQTTERSEQNLSQRIEEQRESSPLMKT